MQLHQINHHTALTEEVVQTLGFVQGFDAVEPGSSSRHEYWIKDKIAIFQYGKSWVVDVLDQAEVRLTMTTVQQLDAFFTGCGLDLGLKPGITDRQQSKADTLRFIENHTIPGEMLESPVVTNPSGADDVYTSFYLRKRVMNTPASERAFNKVVAGILSMIATHFQIDTSDYAISYTTDRHGAITVRISGMV